MILTAHQPCYLPWLGLFDKISSSDLFCYFDIVQYQRKDFNNRNRILNNGNVVWLSVPIEDSNRFNKTIRDVKIVGDFWKKKHLKSIELSYKKAKYFEEYFGDFTNILKKDYKFLVDLNFELLVFFLRVIDINVKIVKASEFNFSGKKSELVLDMCEKLKASKFIFGSQGKNYAAIESFKKKNIAIEFQDYKHPKYNQLSDKFFPNLSILDLIFNEGPRCKKIILNDI
ncbi:WbqC family protein [Candidatus Pelagibacter bacterium nBUS_36]|uniref:WbqC family protein n=1 Tax=Candidatus Pelagibacter bacterium nBUS_36 TaxID=3374194 RepID=UPI003EBB6600